MVEAGCFLLVRPGPTRTVYRRRLGRCLSLYSVRLYDGNGHVHGGARWAVRWRVRDRAGGASASALPADAHCVCPRIVRTAAVRRQIIAIIRAQMTRFTPRQWRRRCSSVNSVLTTFTSTSLTTIVSPGGECKRSLVLMFDHSMVLAVFQGGQRTGIGRRASSNR